MYDYLQNNRPITIFALFLTITSIKVFLSTLENCELFEQFSACNEWSMKICQSQRNQCALLVELSRNIVDFTSKYIASEGLIVHFLHKVEITSAPLPIWLKSCEDCSFKIEIFDAVQLSMSLIFSPLLESISSDSNLKAAFQLYSINCMNSFLDTKLSLSLSYALKVSLYYSWYNWWRFICLQLFLQCPWWTRLQQFAQYCSLLGGSYLIENVEKTICEWSISQSFKSKGF